MAHTSPSRSLLGLTRSLKSLKLGDPLMQCLAPRWTCAYATHVALPVDAAEAAQQDRSYLSRTAPPTIPASRLPRRESDSATSSTFVLDCPVLTTLYSWPTLEPTKFAQYPHQYLDAPLRRDILHRAVIFEADSTRQGTASTKWRFDVHGSNRKLYAQKGTGRARVRDKKSPIRRGGGVAFGPKPRDFSTDLPLKVYQQAFRIALSHRYRRGELIVLDNEIEVPDNAGPRFLDRLLRLNQWGRADGRSLLVTKTLEADRPDMFEKMRAAGSHGTLKDLDDVDVKDLLETGRVVIEHAALQKILYRKPFRGS